jgi:hypothetical protein
LLRGVLVVLGIVVLAGVSRWVYWGSVEHRFAVVSAGKLYQSAEMPADVLLEKVAALDIRTVIDLRDEQPEAVYAEHESLQAAGVRHVSLPVGQIPDQASVDAFLAQIDQPDVLPALVHCEHGQGRSVLFSALYRIEFEGWENERARRATRLFPWWGSFRPGSTKGAYLRAYVPRDKRLAARVLVQGAG